MAHGSLREVETQVMIAERLRYPDSETVVSLLAMTSEVGRLLSGLIRSINQSLPPD